MPDPSAVTYTLVYRDGRTLDEAAVRARGGFVACAADPELDSVVVHDGAAPLVQVVIRPGLRPVFGRLWVQGLDAEGRATGERWLRAVCCGWEQTVETRDGPRTVKTLLWVLPDGLYAADRDLEGIAAGAAP